MVKINEVFFPDPTSRENFPLPPPDGFKESYEDALKEAGVNTNDSALTKEYSTWGPSGLQRNPLRIPLWPVFLGIALFLGLQTVYSVAFLIMQLFSNPDLFQSGDLSSVQEVTESEILTPALVLGSLILGWMGLIFAVYIAGRKYPGGWKNLILWKVSWGRDLVIAAVFTVAVRVLEISLGFILKGFDVNQEELSNSQILTQFTGFTFIAIMIGAGLIAPIVEEVFFRGMFLRGVLDKVWLANQDKTADKVKSNNLIVATLIGFLVFLFVFALTTFASSGLGGENLTENNFVVEIVFVALPMVAGLLAGIIYWKLPSAKSKSVLAGLLFSSLTFGVLHTQATGASSLYTVGFTTLIGLGLGVLFLITGRLGTAVLAHIFLNSSAVVLLFFTELPT